MQKAPSLVALLRRPRLLNPVRNLIQITSCGPSPVKIGLVQAKKPLVLKRNPVNSPAPLLGGGGGLHAEQHFEYHRHIGPGDVLTATVKQGEGWEKEGKRSGKLIFSETITEYHDQNGELVITARGVGVRTERPVDQ
ncbi:MaoC family dehydratase N-terminal domain-containing protein [Pseudomonadales bacterium]|nr:MaoC family dehydratase N-terminal domain-containing protein [Pseudomonadales bacterium]